MMVRSTKILTGMGLEREPKNCRVKTKIICQQLSCTRGNTREMGRSVERPILFCQRSQLISNHGFAKSGVAHYGAETAWFTLIRAPRSLVAAVAASAREPFPSSRRRLGNSDA